MSKAPKRELASLLSRLQTSGSTPPVRSVKAAPLPVSHVFREVGHEEASYVWQRLSHFHPNENQLWEIHFQECSQASNCSTWGEARNGTVADRQWKNYCPQKTGPILFSLSQYLVYGQFTVITTVSISHPWSHLGFVLSSVTSALLDLCFQAALEMFQGSKLVKKYVQLTHLYSLFLCLWNPQLHNSKGDW